MARAFCSLQLPVWLTLLHHVGLFRDEGLRDELAAAQIGQAEAEADAAELRQAEAARKGRGRLARLRAAWRGE